jgi:hypothetical protein
MNQTITVNQLSGRATGAIFFAGFGALWIFLSLYARQLLTVASVSGLLLVLAGLLLAARILLRQAKRFPRLPDDPAMSRAFGWINAIQWIAIAVVVFTLARLHLEAYVMNAITAIVGLHMFPLARLFRYPLNHATGAALVVWAVASIFLVPIGQLQGIAALGTGVILWLSAAITLALAFKAAQQSPDLLAC